MTYKSVRVPAWAYENAQLVLDDLARGGTDQIPARLRTPAIEEALRNGPTLSAVIALGLEAIRQAGGWPAYPSHGRLAPMAHSFVSNAFARRNVQRASAKAAARRKDRSPEPNKDHSTATQPTKKKKKK